MIAATVTGTVGRDAELHHPRGGDQVLSFSVASRRFANGQESTDWVAVSFWGKRAAAIASHVTKGSRVAVRGALHVRTYERAGGGEGWSIEIRADDVELLGGGKDRGDGGARLGHDGDPGGVRELHPTAARHDEGGADADIPF